MAQTRTIPQSVLNAELIDITGFVTYAEFLKPSLEPLQN
jgi:hypothetical protein